MSMDGSSWGGGHSMTSKFGVDWTAVCQQSSGLAWPTRRKTRAPSRGWRARAGASRLGERHGEPAETWPEQADETGEEEWAGRQEGQQALKLTATLREPG